MNALRVTVLAMLSLAVAACTPRVGIAPRDARPLGAAKSVMVVPGDATAGETGDRIELAAWGFTEPGSTTVWFGAVRATEVKIVDGWRVEVVVPPGAGTVDVCVENGAGAWVLLEAFRYPEGEGVEHCWPSSAPVAQVDAAKKRIAQVQMEKARFALAPR